MSLILDALRRAERDHPRDLVRHVSAAPWPRHGRSTPWWPWVALVIAAALATLAVWWVARPGPTTPPAPVVAAVLDTVTTPTRIAPDTSSLDAFELHVPVTPPERTASPPTSAAPFLQYLPAEIRAAMPALELNAHVWSDDPDRRFVMLNMRRHRDGETVATGLTLVRVLPEGAELDWRGTRFRLGRQ